MNKRWKKVSLYVFLPITLIVGAFCIGFWINTMTIVSVANQFKPDSSWKLESETIVPSMPCIAGGGRCPRVVRTWTTETATDRETLQDVLNKSGWHNGVAIGGFDCFSKEDNLNIDTPCSANGYINGYTISLYTDYDNAIFNTPTVTLFVD